MTFGGKDVLFKITGQTPLMYRAMFGKDFLVEFIKLEKQMAAGEEVTDFDSFHHIAYVLAKKGDPSIGDMDTWLDSFAYFPVFDVVKELMPLISLNFSMQVAPDAKKKTRKTATASSQL